MKRRIVKLVKYIYYDQVKKMAKAVGKDLMPSATMKELDKERFNKKVQLPCLLVKCSKKTSEVLPYLKPYLFKAPHFRSVVEENQETTVILDDALLKEYDFSFDEFVKKFDEVEMEQSTKEIQLNYDNFSAEDVLKEILPEGTTLSSWSQIGHIVHVNLREQLDDYKYLIGQVLLDKMKACRTVIAKSEVIEGQFRTLPFELLAGENNYVTRVSEHGIRFEMDFSKVFWNPRLSNEHRQLISEFRVADIVYDVFAGIGPFAVPAAVKKRCKVVANDLNPDCVVWLKRNVELNRAKNVNVYNMDGARFLEDVASKDLRSRILDESASKGSHVVRFIMNLPAIAFDFLPSFIGLLADETNPIDADKVPDVYVYCYTFCRSGTDEGDVAEAEEKVEKVFGGGNISNLKASFVRNVAPYKNMMRAAFKLDANILVNKK